MRKLSLCFILILLAFLPCNFTRVFAGEEKELNIYDIDFINNGYLVLVDDYEFNNDIINAFFVSENQVLNLNTKLDDNNKLRQPLLLSMQEDFYSIYDYDTKKVLCFDNENNYLNSHSEYISSLGLKKNLNLVDIYGFNSIVYGINHNIGLQNSTFSLVCLSKNSSSFETIVDITDFSLDTESKLFVNGNFIYFSCNEGVVEYDTLTKSFKILENTQDIDYFFVDCKNKFHILKDQKLDNHLDLEYLHLICFDRENGSIFSLSNTINSYSNNLDLYSKVKTLENIVEDSSSFVHPNTLNDYSITNLNQIQFASNLHVYLSPYSFKEVDLINQHVIVIGSIKENLNEEFSYVVYLKNSECKTGYVKTNLLQDTYFYEENRDYITLRNNTFVYKGFKNNLAVTSMKKGETICIEKSFINLGERYYLSKLNDEYIICNEIDFALNTIKVTPVLNPNATLQSNSNIIVLNIDTQKTITLNEEKQIQIQSSQDDYIYFLIEIDNEIFTCKTLKTNLVTQDLGYLNILMVTVACILLFLIFTYLALRKIRLSKNKF